MPLRATNVVSFIVTANEFLIKVNLKSKETLSFIEKNEEILNEEKTSSILVLGLQ